MSLGNDIRELALVVDRVESETGSSTRTLIDQLSMVHWISSAGAAATETILEFFADLTLFELDLQELASTLRSLATEVDLIPAQTTPESASCITAEAHGRPAVHS